MNRRFRLATVLRLRSRSESAAADALRAANATLDEARARVDAVRDQLEQPAPASGTPQRPRGEDTADLLAAAHHRARLRDELTTALGEVDRLHRDVESARETWLTARAALRAVESLRERHTTAVRAHDLRTEQREVDELASRPRAKVSAGGRAPSRTAGTGGAA